MERTEKPKYLKWKQLIPLEIVQSVLLIQICAYRIYYVISLFVLFSISCFPQTFSTMLSFLCGTFDAYSLYQLCFTFTIVHIFRVDLPVCEMTMQTLITRCQSILADYHNESESSITGAVLTLSTLRPQVCAYALYCWYDDIFTDVHC